MTQKSIAAKLDMSGIDDNSLSLEEFLLKMESLNRGVDELSETIFPNQNLEPGDDAEGSEYYRTPTGTGIKIISQVETALSAYQNKPIAGYLKRFFSGSLGGEEAHAKHTQETVVKPVQVVKNSREQKLSQIESEIQICIERMDIVLKGSTDCDDRLLEYLSIRLKTLAGLLLKKDFLLENDVAVDHETLEHYANTHVVKKMIELLNELLDSIKETLIANIARENQKIATRKENKAFKKLDEYKWKAFCKRLLARAGS